MQTQNQKQPLLKSEQRGSQVYGSEYLIVELAVTADEPSPTIITLFEKDDVRRGGLSLPAPSTEEGADPTPDRLGCDDA